MGAGKVLVIDDSELVCELIAGFLEGEGWTVHVASSGSDGLEVAARERPEVVLCDLMMPEMDGVEVVRRMRALDPTVPVIVLTGEDERKVVLEALAQGAFDCQIKSSGDLWPILVALDRAARFQRIAAAHARLCEAAAARAVEIAAAADLLRREAEARQDGTVRTQASAIEVSAKQIAALCGRS